MIISFEEKDRVKIEATGMQIIEFKRILYRTSKTISAAWSALENIAERILKGLNAFKNAFLEAVDKVKMYFEMIKDSCGYRTSFRYKTVKLISKVTRIDMWKVWTMTRHTWLARSCC